LRGDPRIRVVTEIEDNLRLLQDKINALTQTRDRAQARADIAQGEVEDGLARLREEFGVSSVEEAEQKIEQGRRKIEQAVEELLAKVEELENG